MILIVMYISNAVAVPHSRYIAALGFAIDARASCEKAIGIRVCDP